MIIANEKTDVQTDGIGQTSRATIKASARLFSFFSDQIYADKFVAIWRELVANGMDAQVAAGNPQQQMLVTLPTDYTPYAKVRDYGTGMGHEFLMNKFMAYTDASTKENSNDFIGGFGIGSKAPLSYTEQFAIHSYQNGEVGIYSVFKDDTGCPSIAFLARHPSTEQDGVEISFPVEAKDIKGFREAAYKTLNYFQPLPLLLNSEQQLFAPEYTVKTPTWGFLKNAQTSRVVQGGIAYPIDAGSVREIDDILGFGIDFYVPIGSCSIALSRERLSYDDRTIRVLKSLVDAIKPDLDAHVASMFTNCKSRWEADAMYASEIFGSGNPHRQGLIRRLATYKGQKLTGFVKPVKHSQLVSIGCVTSSRYNKRGVWSEGVMNPSVRPWLTEVWPRDIQIVLIDDGAPKPVLRMRNYLETHNISDRGVMVLRPHKQEEMTKRKWAEMLIALGRPPFQLLSTIEPSTTATTSRGPARAEKIRAYKSRYFHAPNRGDKFTDTLPDTGGYFMYMENFCVTNLNDVPQATDTELEASGLDASDIFWFNSGDYQKIKNNPLWKPAKLAFDANLIKYQQTHQNMALAQAFDSLFASRYSYNGGTEKLCRTLELIRQPKFDVPPCSSMAKLLDMFNLISKDLNHGDRAMRQLIKVDSSAEYKEIVEMIQVIRLEYPELTLLTDQNNVQSDLMRVYNKLVK